jgi:hypothetical protein
MSVTADVLLVLQATLVVVAIYTYRAQRTTTLRLLMYASICYAIACSSWFTVYFVAGFLWGERELSDSERRTFDLLYYYTDKSFQIAFAILIIAALVSYLKESRRRDAPTI